MQDVTSEGAFPFPVGVLLYNRPAYAEQTLAALKSQTRSFDESRMVIVRDGYVGSREERLGEPNLTAEVDALVLRYFPRATFVKFDENRGIAFAYEELASRNFSTGADWAVFFEEDFVVDADYTSVLERLIAAATAAPQVACLSATGDVAVKRTRGMNTLYPDRHLWAYAMRRSFWEESKHVIDSYLGLLSGRRYWDRDPDHIVNGMAELGIIVAGSSQDYIKLGFMRANGYLALNTAQAHGYYIGQEGLHHNERLFSAWGYDAPRSPRDESPFIPEFTPELLAEMEHISRQMWARENLGYLQTVGERINRIQRTLAETRGALRVTSEALAEKTHALSAAIATGAAIDIPHPQNLGGWTWFGGSSALSIGGVHLLGIVRRQGLTTRGESCVAVIDDNGEVVRVIPLLRQLPLDDHNVPTIVALDKKRFVVAVTGHEDTTTVRVALGVVRDGEVRLGRRVDIDFGQKTSYAHVIPEGDDTFLLLTRCAAQNFRARRVHLPTLEAVTEPMVVFPWEVNPDDVWHSRRDGNRPYLITRESGSEVLFALTHDHPRGYRNGIVAGRFIGADIFDLDGKRVHSLSPDASNWDPFSALTPIVAPGGSEIPWIADIGALSQNGQEIGVNVAYSLAEVSERDFRFDTRGRHPRLKYGVSRRLIGHPAERVFEVAAGPSLTEDESHYAGGIALNPLNPDHVVYAVGVEPDVDEKSAKPATQWKLMSREVTAGEEQTRRISSISSAESFVRPVFSASAPQTRSHALFAMRGRYSTYRDFSTRIHATIFRDDESCLTRAGEHLDLMYAVRAESAMPRRETEFLRRRLRKSQSFAEFGAGGSTLLAFEQDVPRVVSVESDVRLAGFLRALATRFSTSFDVVTPRVAEIGPWGSPVLDEDDGDGDLGRFGREYALALEDMANVDTVLIDGRFRVACALNVASRVARRTMILFDDYGDREHYRVVETYLGRPRMKGRLAVFTLRTPVVIPDAVMSHYLSDPR